MLENKDKANHFNVKNRSERFATFPGNTFHAHDMPRNRKDQEAQLLTGTASEREREKSICARAWSAHF